ncbi:MAG: SHOCT domain-containing protein, partial [Phycisphaeraceae bacterium JB051]
TSCLGAIPTMLGKITSPGYPLVLASARRSGSYASPMFDIFLYSALIAAGVIILVFIAIKLRAWLLDVTADNTTGDFFSISQLRELKDNGSISDEEYESAKRVLVAQGLQMLNSSSAED